eukprot:c18013_g1_i1.p1 GENE.c18013_g1_i1~~c18013_g1_i1.p1  ORF type:complete len:708 (+),score=171.49 c18013_g1_i1:137-2260(+)
MQHFPPELPSVQYNETEVFRASGGETHQVAQGNVAVMTTNQGVPISDNQNTLRANPRSHALLEDFVFRDKIFHFDHERIPERVVHARGYAAHGFFENYECLSEVTCADLFQRPGEQTPAFVRFSTVIGNKGSPDLARDVRGFAVKLYTKEGNWDLVGNNIPVFFIQDAIKFPDVVHAAKPEPDRDFPQAQTAHDNFWDFISLTPESTNMALWIMSDRTIPRSFRFMEGFGVNTFRLVDSNGKSTFVKFHWKPKLGMQSVVWNEAQKINGMDPDFHRRDLWESINSGSFPEWELGLQLLDEEFLAKFQFDVLDCTKIVPEELVPVRRVGRLVLNRMPDNFFLETEQVAFCTQNIVPGIDFSDDPLLQGRNFSYLDTQLKRLGSPNFTHLPINAPKCPVRNFLQDGHMCSYNPKGRANYEPNSWGDTGGPREAPAQGFTSFPEQATSSGHKQRTRPESFADHYSQARQFYLSQTETEKLHIAMAFMFELSKVQKVAIRERVVSHLLNVDPELANQIAKGLRLKQMPNPAPPARPVLTNLPTSPALSIINNGPKSFQGRKLGVLVSDGTDVVLIREVQREINKLGAMVKFIVPFIGGIVASDNSVVEGDERIDGGSSVLFDAVMVLLSEEGAKLLSTESIARMFVTDAFAHLKFIGFNSASLPFLQKAGIAEELDEGCVKIDNPNAVAAFLHRCGQEVRFWARELVVRLV